MLGVCVLKFLLSANLHLKCQLCPTSACLFHRRASDCHTTGLLHLGQRPFTAPHPLLARSVTELAIPTVTATPYTRARLQRNCTVCFHLSAARNASRPEMHGKCTGIASARYRGGVRKSRGLVRKSLRTFFTPRRLPKWRPEVCHHRGGRVRPSMRVARGRTVLRAGAADR